MTNRNDFIKLKGAKGQIDHDEEKTHIEVQNDQVGFKCLHYSVTESNGFVEITIIKKVQSELIIGVRTVPDTAIHPKDYTHIDEIITIKKRDNEYKIKVPIVDDDELEPDLDFKVELYNTNNNERLPGDDTTTVVTILDEDFPGTIQFKETNVTTGRNKDTVEIVIERITELMETLVA